jgi:hypothetical protein
MSWTLDDAVCEILDRLGDEKNEIWSSDEIKLYVKDGYDEFCRQTKCLFDIHVIPNQPVAGNWTTDFERKYISEKPGMGATDERMGITGNHEQDLSDDHSYSRSSPINPTPATSPAETWGKKGSSTTRDGYFGKDSTGSQTTALESIVRGGTLPSSTVEVARVTYDNRDLIGMEPMHLKRLDPYYEDRNGDPQWWTFGKDGLYFLRLVPAANGDATYDDVSGSWGVLRQDTDSSSTVFNASVELVNAQDETSYDSTEDAWLNDIEGSFGGGSGYAVSDTITLSDASVITVDAVSSGVVTEFTVNSASATAAASRVGTTLTASSTSGSGSGFTLTPGLSNVVNSISTWGFLREEVGAFPSGSSWGLVRRRHPDTKNIKIDTFRLGMDLDHNEFEIPDSYLRYIYYYAMHKALERDGYGQDLEMSDHCRGRFMLGVQRMIQRDGQMDDEYIGRFSGAMETGPDFALGDPEPPDVNNWNMTSPY